MLPILMNWQMNSFKLWIIHVDLCSQDPTSSDILRPKGGCWDPQMKSFILVFNMDAELNSVSQNSPFFTPRCKIKVWATIGQGDRPPADQVVKTQEHSLFSLSHSTPSTPSQRTSPHCSDTRSCQPEDLRNSKQVSPELLSCQRKRSDQFPPLPTFIKPCMARTACSTLEPQLSPATTSTFSSKTGNVELGLDSKP